MLTLLQPERREMSERERQRERDREREREREREKRKKNIFPGHATSDHFPSTKPHFLFSNTLQ
jgi:CRISPR/Cas system CSM-associated protein Csm5 (group 7 of RAMP superfamily)